MNEETLRKLKKLLAKYGLKIPKGKRNKKVIENKYRQKLTLMVTKDSLILDYDVGAKMGYSIEFPFHVLNYEDEIELIENLIDKFLKYKARIKKHKEYGAILRYGDIEI